MYAAASTVSWVVVLARAARRRAKFFFLSAAALHTTHTYTWQREHLRVVYPLDYICATILPAFWLCVCGPGARFFSISRRDPPRGAELFWTAVDQHRPAELSHIRSRHHYTRAPVATLKVIWFRFVCGTM